LLRYCEAKPQSKDLFHFDIVYDNARSFPQQPCIHRILDFTGRDMRPNSLWVAQRFSAAINLFCETGL